MGHLPHNATEDTKRLSHFHIRYAQGIQRAFDAQPTKKRTVPSVK